MKLKLIVCVGLFLTLVACTPTAVAPEIDPASRPTVIADGKLLYPTNAS